MEVFNRWQESNRLLKPVVEALPLMLILAVVLFLVGLLDNLLSSALALSPLSRPILGAGILSSAMVGVSGTVIMLTVIHGCVYTSNSPFQSTLSSFLENTKSTHLLWRLIARARSTLYRLLGEQVVQSYLSLLPIWISNRLRAFYDALRGWLPHPHTPNSDDDAASSNHANHGSLYSHRPESGTLPPNLGNDGQVDLLADDAYSLSDMMTRIYHTTLLLTHDDESVNSAIAALWDIIRHSLPASHGISWIFEDHAVDTLLYLLSPECSRRANQTAALTLIKIEGVKLSNCSKYDIG